MMSELEKRIAREIFGEDEARRTQGGDRWVDYGIPSRYPTTSEKGKAYALLVTFVFFLSLGIVSGWWLFYAPVNYLATHIPIVMMAVNFVILSDVALWVFMLLPFFIIDADDDLSWIVSLVFILSLIFAIIGVFVAMDVYGIPSALWVGMHHPFSPGGMNVTSIYSFVTLPTNASLPFSNNATNSLYIATLGINVNGLPLNTTLVITNATFFNPFTHLTCIPYSSNMGKLSFPLVVNIKATKTSFLYLFYLPSINISKIKLSFLCNGIPTKAVLVTNYGNFTYLLAT
jgi:hypothetical protein